MTDDGERLLAARTWATAPRTQLAVVVGRLQIARRAAFIVGALSLLLPEARLAYAESIDLAKQSPAYVQSVQEALIWASNYYGVMDGNWGRIASESAKDWRSANGLPASDLFEDHELRQLIAQGATERRAAGWTTYRDEQTGVWIGYPGQALWQKQPGTWGSGAVSTEWRGDGTVELTLVGPGYDLQAIRELMSGIVHSSEVQKVDYRRDTAGRQVLSTSMTNGVVQYARFDRDKDVWRGFVMRVASSRPDVVRLITAVSAEFALNARRVMGDRSNQTRLGSGPSDRPTTQVSPPQTQTETLPSLVIPQPRVR